MFGETLQDHDAAVPSGFAVPSLSLKAACFGGAGREVMGRQASQQTAPSGSCPWDLRELRGLFITFPNFCEGY